MHRLSLIALFVFLDLVTATGAGSAVVRSAQASSTGARAVTSSHWPQGAGLTLAGVPRPTAPRLLYTGEVSRRDRARERPTRLQPPGSPPPLGTTRPGT